jgi:hypothetical protein
VILVPGCLWREGGAVAKKKKKKGKKGKKK